MSKGFFITFEGIDGAGKTTQARILADKLMKKGERVFVTKEPGDGQFGSEIGPQIREMLFYNPSTKVLAPDSTAMLFLADHIQVVEKHIRPALESGHTVICDRYADSQEAYGPEYGTSEVAMQAYRNLYGIVPDLTIVLLGKPEELYPRTKRVGTAEEGKQDGKTWESIDTQKRVCDRYKQLFEGNKRASIIHVDIDAPIGEIAGVIWTEYVLAKARKRLAEREPELELHADGVKEVDG